MSCSCEGVTCSCGIPCYCPRSTCGCTDCDNSADRPCSLCNLPIIYNDITGNVCSCFLNLQTAEIPCGCTACDDSADRPCSLCNLPITYNDITENACSCFHNHQTVEIRNTEPWRSEITHEGGPLVYDNILKDWVPAIFQHSNLPQPTSQMEQMYDQTQNPEKLRLTGRNISVRISNPIGGGISYDVDCTADGSSECNVSNPTGSISRYVPLNVDITDEPVNALVLTDEPFEEIISNSTRTISNMGLLDVTYTNESLRTENAPNYIYANGIRTLTVMEQHVRDRNITNDWLNRLIRD